MDTLLLLPFFFVAASINETVLAVLDRSALGLGTLSALLLTGVGYALFRERNTKRVDMIQGAYDLLRKIAAQNTPVQEEEPAPLHLVSPRQRQLHAAAKKILKQPDRTPSQRAAGERVVAAIEGRAKLLAKGKQPVGDE
ncbi:MAG: hypothetical protein KGN33_09495 [Paracoccaceae bacterium]|nr:hypothetical protein [Paracoccaceae bacterium]